MTTAVAPAEVTFVEAAPAKINLYLHVTDRRADGYHCLDSLVVFAGAGDVLHYEPGDAPLTLKLAGRFGAVLGEDAAGPDNLVMKAAAALCTLAGPKAAVQGGPLVLAKNLPVASGIGGGSADAAAALRLLDRVWGVPAAPAASDVDGTALRYFGRQGDTVRVQREIERLQALHPDWQPPTDLLSDDYVPDPDIEAI